MLDISPEEIAETLVMVQQQHLDIRTINARVSIGECAADSCRRDGGPALRTHRTCSRAARAGGGVNRA